MDILYRLSMMVGFLLAGFLALLIAALMATLCCWIKSSFRKLDRMLEDLEKMEEACRDEDKS